MSGYIRGSTDGGGASTDNGFGKNGRMKKK